MIADISHAIVFALIFLDMIFIEDEMGEVIGLNHSLIPVYIAIVAGVYLISILYHVLYVKFSGYELAENEIRLKRGVLFRKSSILEYKKINAINKRQNIIQMLFGVAVITVDSGSANTAQKAEIVIIERSDVANSLMNELSRLKNGEAIERSCEKTEPSTIPESLYKFTSGRKVLYAVVNIFTSLFIILCLAVAGFFFYSLASYLQIVEIGIMFRYIMTVLTVSVLIILTVSLITFVTSLLYSFISYYDFKVLRRGDNVEISYGLLVRHENSFNYSKIKGVKISQGIIKRIFGFATINLEVIGYTQDSSEKESGGGIGVLVPFCKMKEVEDILSAVLPSYVPSERSGGAKAYFPLVSWFSLGLAIANAILAALVFPIMAHFEVPGSIKSGVLLLIILLDAIIYVPYLINAILKYKGTSVSLNDGRLTVYKDGFYRVITVFNAKNLIAVESVSTPLQRKAGINSYVLHIKTNSETNEIKLAVQDSAVASILEAELKY